MVKLDTKTPMIAPGMVTYFTILATCLGCSTVKSFFASDVPSKRQPPISNPFDSYYGLPGQATGSSNNVVLRTRKGDRSVEVELPNGTSDLSDFVVPVSPSFTNSLNRGANGDRQPSSFNGQSADLAADQSYKERAPSITDREITANLPQGQPEQEGDRRDIETDLGVVPSEDSAPAADRSYLAAMDHVKALYKAGRYEAALLDIDELLRAYPTNPKLYEMRGTLLDRIGRGDLAFNSWNQALRLQPGNQALRKFVERKQAKRSIAGGAGIQ